MHLSRKGVVSKRYCFAISVGILQDNLGLSNV